MMKKITFGFVLMLVLVTSVFGLRPSIEGTGAYSWNEIKQDTDAYTIAIADKNSQKTEICFWSKTATKLNQLPSHYDIVTDTQTIVLNSKQKNGKYGYCRIVDTETYISMNPQVVYEEETHLVVADSYGDILDISLDIINSDGTRTHVNNEYFTQDTNTGFKFGANMSSYFTGASKPTELTIVSHVPIRQYTDTSVIIDSRDGKQELSFDDVCSPYYANCVIDIQNVLSDVVDANATTSEFSYATLTLTANSLSLYDPEFLDLPDLQAYYKFDDNSSDLTPNDYDATLFGDAYITGTDGHIGNYLYLDGDGDYGRIDLDSIGSSQDFTINFWVNLHSLPNASVTNYRLIGTELGTDMWIYPQYYGVDNISLGFRLWNTAGIQGLHWYNSDLEINAWHMITVSRDTHGGTTQHSDGITMYYDGVSVPYTVGGSDTDLMTSFVSRDLAIGMRGFKLSPTQFAPASFDEFSIFDTGLNDTEVLNLYTFFGAQPPDVSGVTFYALDSNKTIIGNETAFTSDNLEAIEFMQINFSVTSISNITDFRLYFTANGTNACALGNKQSNTCINYSTFIEFRDGYDTQYFDGTQGVIGDYINCTYTGTNLSRVYSCVLDEHYNPNVFKHYEALYNFSDIQYQDGALQKITKHNRLQIFMPHGIPTTADQYKLDFRVQAVGSPTQPLSAFLCNSSYTTGDVLVSPYCVLVAQRMPNQLQDDGTKFRAVFTPSLFSSLFPIPQNASIVLRTAESNPTKYYALKTYGITNVSHTEQWAYSVNSGTTWTNASDGYETEVNINWFNDGASPTAFITKFGFANTDVPNITNSSEYNVVWSINASKNYPPLLEIISPLPSANVNNESVLVSWVITDPNNDTGTTKIELMDDTILVTLASAIPINQTSAYVDLSSYSGTYSLIVTFTENGTTDLFSVNDTHTITISAPSVTNSASARIDTAECPDTDNQMRLIGWIIVIIICMFLFGIVSQNSWIGLVAGMGVVWVGMTFWACNEMIGAIIVGFGALCIWGFGTMKTIATNE